MPLLVVCKKHSGVFSSLREKYDSVSNLRWMRWHFQCDGFAGFASELGALCVSNSILEETMDDVAREINHVRSALCVSVSLW